jgi:hypothetical protein
LVAFAFANNDGKTWQTMFFNKHIGKPKHLWWMNSGDVLFSCLALCIPKFDAF